MTLFTELNDAIESNDFSRALDLATAGWRARRLSILADLVDAIAAKTPFEVIPKRADSGAFGKEWLARAKDPSARTISALLPTLLKQLLFPTKHFWDEGTARTRYKAWFKRIEALSSLPDDPRVARSLVELLRKAPWSSLFEVDVKAVYQPAIDLLARIADERTETDIRLLIEKPQSTRQIIRQNMQNELPAVLDAIQRTKPAQKRLSPAETAQAKALLDRLGFSRPEVAPKQPAGSKEKEKDLLDLVLRDPKDDGARAVLADYWIERGDPRGELIALQLKPEQSEASIKAARAIIRTHEKAWLGDLALVTKGRSYVRGFLDQIELLNNAAAEERVWKTVTAHPLLATVRRVHKGAANTAHYWSFLSSPAMRGLEEVVVVSRQMLADACKRSSSGPSPTITQLVLEFVPNAKDIASLVAASPNFPRLSDVALGVQPKVFDKVSALATSLAQESKTITRIALLPLRWYRDSTDVLQKWLLSIHAMPTHIAAVEIVWWNGRTRDRVIVTRGKKKGSVRIDVESDFVFRPKDPIINLPNTEELSIRLCDGGDLQDYVAAELKTFIKKYPGKVTLDEAWTKLLEPKPKKKKTA